MHPFLLAQSWRQQLDHDTRLTKARIAAREGISRARVTQVMNLLQLPAEIQANLLRPSASSIRAFELLSGDFLMVGRASSVWLVGLQTRWLLHWWKS
jgi:ParB-like chromosome segregation protein Spo0J